MTGDPFYMHVPWPPTTSTDDDTLIDKTMQLSLHHDTAVAVADDEVLGFVVCSEEKRLLADDFEYRGNVNDDGFASHAEDAAATAATMTSHSHINLTSSTRIWTELRIQLGTALPASQSLVLSKIPWFITLRFLGSLGGEELASAALATTLNNVTGLSFCVGFSFALSTLAGQAKGAMVAKGASSTSTTTTTTIKKDLEREEIELTTLLSSSSVQSLPSDGTLPSSQSSETPPPNTTIVFLIRGMVFQLCLIFPVGMVWICGIDDLLLKLGQSPTTAQRAAAYLQVLAPSLWAYGIQWTLTAWVQAIGMADVPAQAALLGLALHVPFNGFFLYVLDLGYLGCAWAVVAFQTVQMTYLLVYLFVSPHGRSRVLECTGGRAIGRTSLTFWPEFRLAVSSWRGFLQYMGLALPGMVIISEWWASETAIFLSGRLYPDSESALGGMTLYQSINSFCFMFPMSFAVAATARVSNLLGAGQAEAAAWAGRVSVASAAVVSTMIGTILFVVPHDSLPRLFVPDEEGIIEEASSTIPLLSLYVVADGIQIALNGIIKGCGRQCITVPIVVLAYWIIGVPLAYYLAFVKHEGESYCDTEDDHFCGDVGLVAGMTTGTWIHMLMLAMAVACTINWTEEARKAKERVVEHN